METITYVLAQDQYTTFMTFGVLVVALLAALLVSTWGN